MAERPIAITLPAKAQNIRINPDTGQIRMELDFDKAKALMQMIFRTLIAIQKRKENVKE